MKAIMIVCLLMLVTGACHTTTGSNNTNNTNNINNISNSNNIDNTNNINNTNNNNNDNRSRIPNYDCDCTTCKKQINIFENLPARLPIHCFETYHSHAVPPHSTEQTLDFGLGNGGIVEMGKEVESLLRYYNNCPTAVYITATWWGKDGYIPEDKLPKDTPFRLYDQPQCGGKSLLDYYFRVRYAAKKSGTFTLTLRLHFTEGYTNVHLKAVTPE